MSEPHLVFHPAVGEDLESILAYYAERDPALPSRFRARLKEQADRLLMFPESGTILFESTAECCSSGSRTWWSTS